MPELQASRRLVKSPPELWAEVSDAASLARHLGELGEIRITRLEPETTVAWEGESASGTVELAPAGWGTAVTLTAAPTAVEAAAEPVAPPPAEPEPAQEPEPVLAPEPAPARRSWLTTLFRRRPAAAEAPVPAVEAPVSAVAEEPPAPSEAPADPLLDVLTGALDSLGSAHHRPFSRG
jgi:hypothetical protein